MKTAGRQRPSKRTDGQAGGPKRERDMRPAARPPATLNRPVRTPHPWRPACVRAREPTRRVSWQSRTVDHEVEAVSWPSTPSALLNNPQSGVLSRLTNTGIFRPMKTPGRRRAGPHRIPNTTPPKTPPSAPAASAGRPLARTRPRPGRPRLRPRRRRSRSSPGTPPSNLISGGCSGLYLWRAVGRVASTGACSGRVQQGGVADTGRARGVFSRGGYPVQGRARGVFGKGAWSTQAVLGAC
jgi:hypothetical protein